MNLFRLVEARECERRRYCLHARSSKYSKRFRRLAEPLSHLEDCPGIHYRLQVNCYKYPTFVTISFARHGRDATAMFFGSKDYGRVRGMLPRVRIRQVCALQNVRI